MRTLLQMSSSPHGRTARYGLVAVVTGLTFILCLLFEQAFGQVPSVIVLTVPVAVSSWYGGMRAGLLAALLGGLAYEYYFLEPRRSWVLTSPEGWGSLALFAGTCWLISWLLETTKKAQRQAEVNLREIEGLIGDLDTERARLKVVVEHMPAGLLMADAISGQIVMANPGLEQMVGHPLISPPGTRFQRDWVAYHSNGQPFQTHEYPLERSLGGETVRDLEALYSRADGSWKGWVRVNTAPIRDTSGQIVGVVGIATDISEERQAREALRRSQERLRVAQKAAHIGTFEWDIQTGVNIWSEEIEAIYGLSPGSFGGTYEAWMEFVHPEDRAQAEEDVQRALEYGEYISEWRVILPDGDIRWIQARGKVYYEKAGQPLCLFGINKDVTERKFIDEKLRASERRLKIALAAVQMGTYHRDWLTNELDCSGACKKNFGRSPDATFTYDDLVEAIHPDDRGRVREVVRQGEERHEEFQDEFRVIWPDGSLHWIYFCGRVTCGSDGQPLHADGVTLDVTERKVMEESLRHRTETLQETDRRKDEFMAMLAHELRNPLAPIRNAVQILSKVGDDRATVAESCEVLDRQLRHMARLLDDLLDVSRVGRGKITLRKTPLDLAQVVSAAVETSRPLIEAHHHKLMISLPESPVFVEADPVRLAQVLSNLLNNAAKFTNDGGRIDLVAERVNAEMKLRVRDNGIGIPPDKLAQVFEMFAQVESDTERSQSGLGVGLTLARRLVEMQGGRIEAYSSGLGRGSEFTVYMPALTEPLTESIRKSVEDLSTQAARVSRRVLIVDDNEDTAKSLAVMLRIEGHEARIAHSGLTAMDEAREFRPEFIFLDINLPGMNGFDVARRLRLDPELGGVTIVAVTGYGQKEDRRRTQEAGFDHHLVKPVDPEMIYELMSSLPDGQSRRPLSE